MHNIEIETRDAVKVIEKFVLFGNGESVDLTEWEKPLLIGICKELWNTELLELTVGDVSIDLTISNVLDRLKFGRAAKLNIWSMIEFVASNFSSFSTSLIELLDFSILNEILSCESLKIESDDNLCVEILKKTESDLNYFSLLSFVRFEYVSSDVILKVICFIDSSFELFNYSIWSAFHNRILQPISIEVDIQNDLFGPTVNCPFRTDSPFSGIIAHLTVICGGNVHDHDVVKITSNRTRVDVHYPKNVADFGSNEGFWSDEVIGQWLSYDFGNRRVSVTGYSIRSHEQEYDAHPHNWVLEGSNDGSEWIKLDSQENNTELDGALRVATFKVQRCEPVRMIRIRSTGLSIRGWYYLGFSAFEVFGMLHEQS
jgi:hypothetical protein